MALRSHLGNVDSLIQLHDNRLYALETHFQGEVKVTKEEFEKEKEIVDQKFSQEKKDLLSIIAHIETEEQKRESEAKFAFEQMREEIRNRALEDINMLR